MMLRRRTERKAKLAASSLFKRVASGQDWNPGSPSIPPKRISKPAKQMKSLASGNRVTLKKDDLKKSDANCSLTSSQSVKRKDLRSCSEKDVPKGTKKTCNSSKKEEIKSSPKSPKRQEVKTSEKIDTSRRKRAAAQKLSASNKMEEGKYQVQNSDASPSKEDRKMSQKSSSSPKKEDGKMVSSLKKEDGKTSQKLCSLPKKEGGNLFPKLSSSPKKESRRTMEKDLLSPKTPQKSSSLPVHEDSSKSPDLMNSLTPLSRINHCVTESRNESNEEITEMSPKNKALTGTESETGAEWEKEAKTDSSPTNEAIASHLNLNSGCGLEPQKRRREFEAVSEVSVKLRKLDERNLLVVSLPQPTLESETIDVTRMTTHVYVSPRSNTASACKMDKDSFVYPSDISTSSEFLRILGLMPTSEVKRLEGSPNKLHREAGGKLRRLLKPRLMPGMVYKKSAVSKGLVLNGIARDHVQRSQAKSTVPVSTVIQNSTLAKPQALNFSPISKFTLLRLQKSPLKTKQLVAQSKSLATASSSPKPEPGKTESMPEDLDVECGRTEEEVVSGEGVIQMDESWKLDRKDPLECGKVVQKALKQKNLPLKKDVNVEMESSARRSARHHGHKRRAWGHLLRANPDEFEENSKWGSDLRCAPENSSKNLNQEDTSAGRIPGDETTTCSSSSSHLGELTDKSSQSKTSSTGQVKPSQTTLLDTDTLQQILSSSSVGKTSPSDLPAGNIQKNGAKANVVKGLKSSKILPSPSKKKKTNQATEATGKIVKSVSEVKIASSSGSTLNSYSLLSYRSKESDCVIPHMCAICWVNDHMYCRNMKRTTNDLPAFGGGCIHYIPCSHYLARSVFPVNQSPKKPVFTRSKTEPIPFREAHRDFRQGLEFHWSDEDLLCREEMADFDSESGSPVPPEGTEILTVQLHNRADQIIQSLGVDRMPECWDLPGEPATGGSEVASEMDGGSVMPEEYGAEVWVENSEDGVMFEEGGSEVETRPSHVESTIVESSDMKVAGDSEAGKVSEASVADTEAGLGSSDGSVSKDLMHVNSSTNLHVICIQVQKLDSDRVIVTYPKALESRELVGDGKGCFIKKEVKFPTGADDKALNEFLAQEALRMVNKGPLSHHRVNSRQTPPQKQDCLEDSGGIYHPEISPDSKTSQLSGQMNRKWKPSGQKLLAPGLDPKKLSGMENIPLKEKRFAKKTLSCVTSVKSELKSHDTSIESEPQPCVSSVTECATRVPSVTLESTRVTPVKPPQLLEPSRASGVESSMVECLESGSRLGFDSEMVLALGTASLPAALTSVTCPVSRCTGTEETDQSNLPSVSWSCSGIPNSPPIGNFDDCALAVHVTTPQPIHPSSVRPAYDITGEENSFTSTMIQNTSISNDHSRSTSIDFDQDPSAATEHDQLVSINYDRAISGSCQNESAIVRKDRLEWHKMKRLSELLCVSDVADCQVCTPSSLPTVGFIPGSTNVLSVSLPTVDFKVRSVSAVMSSVSLTSVSNHPTVGSTVASSVSLTPVDCHGGSRSAGVSSVSLPLVDCHATSRSERVSSVSLPLVDCHAIRGSSSVSSVSLPLVDCHLGSTPVITSLGEKLAVARKRCSIANILLESVSSTHSAPVVTSSGSNPGSLVVPLTLALPRPFVASCLLPVTHMTGTSLPAITQVPQSCGLSLFRGASSNRTSPDTTLAIDASGEGTALPERNKVSLNVGASTSSLNWTSEAAARSCTTVANLACKNAMIYVAPVGSAQTAVSLQLGQFLTGNHAPLVIGQTRSRFLAPVLKLRSSGLEVVASPVETQAVTDPRMTLGSTVVRPLVPPSLPVISDEVASDSVVQMAWNHCVNDGNSPIRHKNDSEKDTICCRSEMNNVSPAVISTVDDISSVVT